MFRVYVCLLVCASSCACACVVFYSRTTSFHLSWRHKIASCKCQYELHARPVVHLGARRHGQTAYRERTENNSTQWLTAECYCAVVHEERGRVKGEWGWVSTKRSGNSNTRMDWQQKLKCEIKERGEQFAAARRSSENTTWREGHRWGGSAHISDRQTTCFVGILPCRGSKGA